MSTAGVFRRPKPDDKNVQAIREIQGGSPENKKCLDCGQPGPTYVNMTIGSFVCTKCSGILRGITPPHRIKSISMSTFTPEEVMMIRSHGNHYCRQVWSALLIDKSSPSFNAQEITPKDPDALKQAIVDKYEKKRYYVDPSSLKISSPPQSIAVISSSDASSSSLSSHGLIGSTISQSKYSRPSPQNHGSLGPLKPPSAILNGGLSTGIVTGSQAVMDSFDAFRSDKIAEPKFESFANFETADFTTPSADTFAATPPGTSTPLATVVATTTSAIQPNRVRNVSVAPPPTMKSSTDRYAALKDLDEIFKSSVSVGEGASTGTDLFGASAAPLAGMFAAMTSPLLFNATPTTNDAFGSPQSYKSERSDNDNVGWANFGDDISSKVGDNRASSSLNINPFTGSTNLTQLNTSPWPTTGASPVLSTAPSWPNDPFSTSTNLFQSDHDLFANAPKPNFLEDAGTMPKDLFEFPKNHSISHGNPWDNGGLRLSEGMKSTNPFL